MKKYTLVQAACLLACAASPFAAQSQSGSPANAADTPEIIVTASRSEQVLQTAPVGATVLTADQIRSSGAVDAIETIKMMTNIVARTDLSNGRNWALDVRGFGETARDNTVFLVDGIRVSENEQAAARLSAIAAHSIERIEILRGSSGVVWGEGASAGVVNVILKKTAQNGLAGQAGISIESFNTKDIFVGLQFGAGATYSRYMVDISARDFSTDGYRDNSANKQKTASLGFGFDRDAVSLRLRVHNDKQDSRLPGPLTSYAKFMSNPSQTEEPKNHGAYEENRLSGTLAYNASNWTLSIDAATRQRKAQANYYSKTTGALTYNSLSSTKSTQLSPKLVLRNEVLKSSLNTTIGTDHIRWASRNDSNYISGVNEENGSQTNHAVFFTTDILLPSATRLVWGWRKEAVTKSAIDVPNFVNNVDSGKVLNARELSVNQTIEKGVDVYVRTASSFRVANIDERRFLTASLNPQTSQDQELGIKWAGIKHTSTLRYFSQKTDNEIAYDPTAGGFGANVNLDKTRRTGLELEGTVALTKQLTMSGALQTMSAVFDSGTNFGKRIPMVSDRSAMLRIGYKLDSKQKLDVSGRYLGSAPISNDNANTCSQQIPSNRIYDFSYRWSESRYEFGFGINNLMDHKSYTAAYSCTNGNLYPDPGRTVKASFKYNF